jgi:hypothetical protein
LVLTDDRLLSIPWQKPPFKRFREILLPHGLSRKEVRPERCPGALEDPLLRQNVGDCHGPGQAKANYIDPRNGKLYPLDVPRWCSDERTPLLVTPGAGRPID